MIQLRKLQRAVVDALEDVKAQQIQVFDTTELTSLFDRVIITSATSNRQSRALAQSVHDKAKSLGIAQVLIEGAETGEWVLVDVGDIVVHIMQPAIRAYYNLEEIWGGKPVRVKLQTGRSPSNMLGTPASQVFDEAAIDASEDEADENDDYDNDSDD